jgi:predicted metal-binding protein
MTLLICRTCPRYDAHATGEFGRRLAAVITDIAQATPKTAVAVRSVHCLGGCPDYGVVAVDGPQKTRVRFTGVDPTDAKAVYTAALAHAACATGAPEDWEIPAELADRVSAVTRKRTPCPQAASAAKPQHEALPLRPNGRWVLPPRWR